MRMSHHNGTCTFDMKVYLFTISSLIKQRKAPNDDSLSFTCIEVWHTFCATVFLLYPLEFRTSQQNPMKIHVDAHCQTYRHLYLWNKSLPLHDFIVDHTTQSSKRRFSIFHLYWWSAQIVCHNFLLYPFEFRGSQENPREYMWMPIVKHTGTCTFQIKKISSFPAGCGGGSQILGLGGTSEIPV